MDLVKQFLGSLKISYFKISLYHIQSCQTFFLCAHISDINCSFTIQKMYIMQVGSEGYRREARDLFFNFEKWSHRNTLEK